MSAVLPAWFFFILGCIFGSFLNVCIYRIPRRESIVTGSSHCQNCACPVKFYDNIPIISFFLLMGKCRFCKSIISLQYPTVELLTGIIVWLIYTRFGLSVNFFIFSAFAMTLIVLSVIDVRHQLLLDKLVLPGILVGFLLSFFRMDFSPTQAVNGFLLGGGSFFLIAIISQRGMGGGDIKLMALCGTFIGWKNTLLTIITASLTGIVVGGLFILASKKGRKTRIPFGPFISLGALVSILWGKEIITWYIGNFFLF